MGRLKMLGAPVRMQTPALRRLELDHDAERRTREARRWYNTSRWKAKPHGLRWQCLERDNFTCQWPGCGRIEMDTSQLVADHKEPHRGDPALFFDLTNLQTLCKPCHDSEKQRVERAQGIGGV